MSCPGGRAFDRILDIPASRLSVSNVKHPVTMCLILRGTLQLVHIIWWRQDTLHHTLVCHKSVSNSLSINRNSYFSHEGHKWMVFLILFNLVNP